MEKNPPTRAMLSVSELTNRARQLLEHELAHLWVVGEIATISRPASGHWYFTLKDDRAQVRCVMFRQQTLQVRAPKQGDDVLVCGRVSLYEARGDFQLIISVLEYRGTGALFQQFEARKKKLQEEGLFAEELKRPLPDYPKQIGLITSRTGAALQDMLSTAQRLAPGVTLLLYPCAVQGEEAPVALRAALDLANRHNLADVLILGRGGGSYEDLFSFNDEQLARDIRHSAIPVVSAVGHEVDFTIADFVADYRAPTPTAAMERVLRKRSELRTWVQTQRRHLQQAMTGALSRCAERLDALTRRLRSPRVQLEHLGQGFDQIEAQLVRATSRQVDRRLTRMRELNERLRLASPGRHIENLQRAFIQQRKTATGTMQRLLDGYQSRLSHQVALLEGVSPLATVKRGYAILRLHSGEVLRSPTQVSIGDPVEAQVRDGKLQLRVDDKPDETSGGQSSNKAARSRAPRPE